MTYESTAAFVPPTPADPRLHCATTARAFRSTAACVAENGASPELVKALRVAVGYAGQFEDLERAARLLGRELDAASARQAGTQPLFTPGGLVNLGAFTDRLCDADARTKDTDYRDMAGLASAHALTVRERATFPRVVIEEAALDAGVYLMYRAVESKGRYRLAWDPAQITRAKVEIFINIYIAGTGEYVEYTPAVDRALRGLEGFRAADPDPAALAFWDGVEQEVIASDDPAAAVARISELITAEQAGPVTA